MENLVLFIAAVTLLGVVSSASLRDSAKIRGVLRQPIAPLISTDLHTSVRADIQADVLSAVEGVPPCSCDECVAAILQIAEEDSHGLQCTVKSDLLAQQETVCRQQGPADRWVIQISADLDYTRFCSYSCKPQAPDDRNAAVPCMSLTSEEVRLLQTPSGNGRSKVYEFSPMVNSTSLSMLKGGEATGANQMVSGDKALRDTFSDEHVRVRDKAAAPEEGQPSCPDCHCHCPESPPCPYVSVPPPPPPPPPSPPLPPLPPPVQPPVATPPQVVSPVGYGMPATFPGSVPAMAPAVPPAAPGAMSQPMPQQPVPAGGASVVEPPQGTTNETIPGASVQPAPSPVTDTDTLSNGTAPATASSGQQQRPQAVQAAPQQQQSPPQLPGVISPPTAQPQQPSANNPVPPTPQQQQQTGAVQPVQASQGAQPDESGTAGEENATNGTNPVPPQQPQQEQTSHGGLFNPPAAALLLFRSRRGRRE
ncbi:unnamed protein product [Vitrella brassicaformis CCMP3155]|uniref:Uncharacterized protein n=2 Tax=Vitrella brassicaformis TaxID=1169539 RepID=A0A0G4F005_VITBC|nr:unnamed protein product [Vitrella brassicaformis CCMP3155]|eukprot:CEM04863.1 unnamed protein product [Vitrella brassicaformis CCMP3155]